MPPFESPWEYFSLFFVYLLSVWRLSSIHGVWVSGKKRRIHANKGFIEGCGGTQASTGWGLQAGRGVCVPWGYPLGIV